MKSRELAKLGIPRGETMALALRLIAAAAASGVSKKEIRQALRAVTSAPDEHLRHPHFAELARGLMPVPRGQRPFFEERGAAAPWRQWGEDLDAESVNQMKNACRLPIAVYGALMPDAHVGYGLPIGGVLATDGTVIPYAVGVDIACRMRLSVLDIPPGALKGEEQRLAQALERETRFGVGAEFKSPHDHEVMDADWNASTITAQLKEKARRQLGTSGSGNHFIELGVFTLEQRDLGLEPGTYLALLSHSGSRGPGNTVASHYSKLAMRLHPELPNELRHLAWLDLDHPSGQEYWAAMQLMGRYAAANHEIIHREVVRALRAKVLTEVENHHNFAWIEEHAGRRVVVHRKGATPAGPGVLGVIPGSMASPGYVVRGKGCELALDSASHGAGRVMSRKQALKTFTWSAVRKELELRGVKVLSAGLDEAPWVYKDIDMVMGFQRDLVEIVARLDPKLVKMAPPGERPED